MKIALRKRLLSLLLAAVFAVSALTVLPAVSGASDGTEPTPENIGAIFTDEATGISVSYARMFAENGVPITAVSGLGSHGGHEMRIARTEYGTYAAYITGLRDPDDEHARWDNGIATFSIVKITADGFHVIFTDDYPKANGSCTPNVINAGNGKLYVTVICGDMDRYYETMGTGSFTNAIALSVYEVDTETDTVSAPPSPTVIDFETSPFEDHGYGYTMPILDTEHGKLYALACGGEAPGYLAWFIYDLGTGTWDANCYTCQLFARYCYINGYPDGNGGFTFVIERDAPVSALKESLGLDFTTNSGYVFDAVSIMRVADPTVEELEEIPVCSPVYTEAGYKDSGKNRVDSASHYGPDGCTYLDSRNRIHIIYSHKVGNTGVKTVYHAIYDRAGNKIYDAKIPTSLIPTNGTTKYARSGYKGFAMNQGYDGKYYVFVLTNENVATLEIWSSPADDGRTFQKIVGPLTLTDPDGNTISSAAVPIIANSRNRSVRDGVASIMFHSTATVNGADPYYYVSVRLDDPAAHEHAYVTVVTEPACTEQGFTTYVCPICGDIYVDDYVDPSGHLWNGGVVTTPATGTDDGVMTYTCLRCGETRTEVIPKKGDDLTDSTKIFKDVKRNGWYTEAVNYVYTCGLMNGMTADTFVPDAEMSRAMLVTVLWRAENSPAPKGGTPFVDLRSDWYREAVAWAYGNNIVKGTSGTTFSPDDPITREQIAAIFFRYAEYKSRDLTAAADVASFPDGGKVSKYARPAMSWAVAEGLISGTKIGNVNYLDPKGNATRAQVATILMRYLKK